MCAILMIASAHLSHSASDDRQLRTLELQHLLNTAAGMRQSLTARDDSSGTDVVLATGLLLYTHAWASPANSRNTDQAKDHTLDIDFLVPLGVKFRSIVQEIALADILRSSIFGYMARFRPKLELLNAVRCTDLSQRLEDQLSSEYQSTWPICNHRDNARFELYAAECKRLLPVISVLKLAETGCDIGFLESSIVRYLYSWPMLIADEFVDLIESRAPCADLLFWHFCTTLRSSPACLYWWATRRTEVMAETLGRRLQEQGIRPRRLLHRNWLPERLADSSSLSPKASSMA